MTSITGLSRKIVRSCFETEAQNSDPRVPLCRNELHAPGDLHFVARQDGGKNRQLQIVHLGLIGQRPKIFGQARASERKSGSQISRRDVELPILTKDVHDLMRVDAEETCIDCRFHWQSRSSGHANCCQRTSPSQQSPNRSVINGA